MSFVAQLMLLAGLAVAALVDLLIRARWITAKAPSTSLRHAGRRSFATLTASRSSDSAPAKSPCA